MFTLSPTSEQRLDTVHADLAKVVRYVAANCTLPPGVTFTVAQACRTAEEEFTLWREFYNLDGTPKPDGVWKTNCNGYPKGSKTPQGAIGTGLSNHQGGHAVDLAIEINGVLNWQDKHYEQLAGIILGAAAKLGIPMNWGGTFPRPDRDHFELNKHFYP